METFDGQVALVTGSSRGIGAAIALRLARGGAMVAVHGRDVDRVRAAVASVAAEGGKAFAVTGDVTDFAQVEQIRARVEAEAGPVDILVANAGGSLTPPADTRRAAGGTRRLAPAQAARHPGGCGGSGRLPRV